MNRYIFTLAFLTSALALFSQPTAPSYQSSTAYIIWYDAYMRDHAARSNSSSGSGAGTSSGGGGSTSVGTGNRSLDRMMRKSNKYYAEQDKKNRMQTTINQIVSDGDRAFWEAADAYERGDFKNCFVLYEKYKSSLNTQYDYSTKNKVKPTVDMYSSANYDPQLKASYDFLISMKKGDYQWAMTQIWSLLPFKFDIGDYNSFPTGTVKYFRSVKEISECKDIRTYLGIVKLLGYYNMGKDGQDILSKLSPALRDSINNDYDLMIEYAMAEVSVHDYNNAIKTLNEVMLEPNNPMLNAAIADELSKMLLGNRIHDKLIIQYTSDLLENAIKQTTDTAAAAYMRVQKDELLSSTGNEK